MKKPTEMDSLSSSSEVCNPTMNPLFVCQHQVELTVIRNNVSAVAANLIVKDVHGSLLFRVKDYPVAIHVHDVRVLLYHEDIIPVITLRKRIMTMHNQWQIFKGESKASSDLLYTVKSNSMFKSKTKLDIFLAGSGTCDYKVRGNWTDGSCEVYAGRTSSSLVATAALRSLQMSRKVSDGTQSEGDDELTIRVYPNVDFLFIISLVLILDKIDRDTAAAAHQSYADPVGIL